MHVAAFLWMMMGLICPLPLAASAQGQEWGDQLVQTVRTHAYRPVPEAVLASGDIPKILASLDPASRIVAVKPSGLDFVRGFVQEGSLEGPVMFHPRIAYFKIRFFGRRTAGEFRRALQKLGPQSVTGLLLDLRFNKGGLLLSTKELIESWIPAGGTCFVAEQRRARILTYVSQNPDPLKIPTVLLVNSRTASCPEVFAAGLRNAGKAKLVGVATYGKQTIQEAFPLDAHRVLFLTTARYRVSGADAGGIIPDIRVADDTQQLKSALMLLRRQGTGP